jgi:uncharacterized membrane protein
MSSYMRRDERPSLGKMLIQGYSTATTDIRTFILMLMGVLIALLVLLLTLGAGIVMTKTTENDRDQWFFYKVSTLYNAIGVGDRHGVTMNWKTDGKMHEEPILAHDYVELPTPKRLNAKVDDALYRGFMACLCLWLGGCVIWFMFLQKRGEEEGTDAVVRGARIISQRELRQQIEDHNQKVFKERRATPSAVSVAGIPYPTGAEFTGTLWVGIPGTGKTVGIMEQFEMALAARMRFLCYDKTTEFTATFYDPSVDVIINPLDERGTHWNLLDEAQTFSECVTLAHNLIAHTHKGDKFFTDAARTVVACAMWQTILHARADATEPQVGELVAQLTATDNYQLHAFLRGTEAATLINPENEKTTGSIRATIQVGARALAMLVSDRTSKESDFSFRKWIAGRGRGVFLTSRSLDHEALRPLITAAIEAAIRHQMAQPAYHAPQLWAFLDELPSLGELVILQSALAEGRKYNIAIVAGIQAISQLREIYDKEGADSLFSMFQTKSLLRVADTETAEELAKLLGQAEVRRVDESKSYGPNVIRDGATMTRRTEKTDAVMPSQLTKMDNLTGYLIPASYFYNSRFVLKYRGRKKRVDGYVQARRTPDLTDIIAAYHAAAEEWEGLETAPNPHLRPGSPQRRPITQPARPGAPKAVSQSLRPQANPYVFSPPKPGPAETGAETAEEGLTQWRRQRTSLVEPLQAGHLDEPPENPAAARANEDPWLPMEPDQQPTVSKAGAASDQAFNALSGDEAADPDRLPKRFRHEVDPDAFHPPAPTPQEELLHGQMPLPIDPADVFVPGEQIKPQDAAGETTDAKTETSGSEHGETEIQLIDMPQEAPPKPKKPPSSSSSEFGDQHPSERVAKTVTEFHRGKILDDEDDDDPAAEDTENETRITDPNLTDDPLAIFNPVTQLAQALTGDSADPGPAARGARGSGARARKPGKFAISPASARSQFQGDRVESEINGPDLDR